MKPRPRPAPTLGARLLRAVLRRAFRPPRARSLPPLEARPRPAGSHLLRLAPRSRRGTALAAWLLQPAEPPEGGAPLVLGLHGWGSEAGALWPLAAPLLDAGFALLLLDAGGHGASEAEAFMSMPRFAEDLAAARAAVAGLPGLAARPVGLIGHSVGAGACLLHAAEAEGVGAVVSLSAFADPGEATAGWLAARGLRGPLQRRMLAEVEALLGQSFASFAPWRSAARLRAPLLLVHGRRDSVARPEDARRLHAAAPASRLLWVEADHDLRPALAAHAGTLRAFLQEHLAGPGPAGADPARAGDAWPQAAGRHLRQDGSLADSPRPP